MTENLGDLLDEDRRNVAEASRKAQDELGELCDARVDLGIIATFEKRGAFAGAEADVSAYIERTQARADEIVSSLGPTLGA